MTGSVGTGGGGQRAGLAAGACVLALLAVAGPAAAGRDYDPDSREWNGLGRLVEIGRELGLEVRTPRLLDWDAVSPETGVLVVYPTSKLSRVGLVGFLRKGGRVLLADDFGGTADTLAGLGVRRTAEPVGGGLRFRDEAHLPVAVPADESHVLTAGVRRLVANHPATFDTDLPPVFVTGEPPRTLVAVGAVGPGRLVLLGDPSVLINNMLELRGNERFVRNLLELVGGDVGGQRGGTVLLFAGRFAQSAAGAPVTGAAAAARNELNGLVAELSDALRPAVAGGMPPPWVLLLALLSAAGATFLLVMRLGPRPRLYSGRWVAPMTRQRAAGFVGTVEYLGDSKATHLYPLLILKRELEVRLLEGLGLVAPARLEAVLAAYAKVEPSPRLRSELEGLLVHLGTLAATAASGSPRPVTARQLHRTFERARRLLRPVGQDIEAT